MPQGDKYKDFTRYLKEKHLQGVDSVTIRFSEIEEVLGFPLPESTRNYSWVNDKTQSYALGWMLADFIVSKCDLAKQTVIFTYHPQRVEMLFSGTAAFTISSKKNSPRDDIPAPCAKEVLYYLDRWDNTEDYIAQEKALNKLFKQTYPHNDKIEEVLIKASVLNDFYSTNIFKIYWVAKHILTLQIDERLEFGDETLVDDIAPVTYQNGKIRKEYSFATKYCSHHHPKDFPIYDDYIKKVLEYCRDIDHFCAFKASDLLDYPKFKSVLCDFRLFYHLEKFDLKELDQYLWQLGKLKFPKKY